MASLSARFPNKALLYDLQRSLEVFILADNHFHCCAIGNMQFTRAVRAISKKFCRTVEA
jgi:hypothetical protein